MRRRRGGDSFRIVSTLLSSYASDGGATPFFRIAGIGHVQCLRRAGVGEGWLYQRVVVLAVVTVVASSFGGFVSGVAACVVGVTGIRLSLVFKIRERREGIDRDLPALVNSISSSVRAGIDPLSALISAQGYFPPEGVVFQEIEVIRGGLNEGRHEEELIEGFLAIFDHQDSELFKRCLILSRRHGSQLAEPLQRVTRVVRQRQSFRRKTRAALAMHRMSAMGITLCACVIAVIQIMLNAQGLAIAIRNPLASKILMVGAALMLIGIWWMMSMGSEEETR